MRNALTLFGMALCASGALAVPAGVMTDPALAVEQAAERGRLVFVNFHMDG
jgi:hypothetical protein